MRSCAHKVRTVSTFSQNLRSENDKVHKVEQVAQRATIAHPSPVCQSQSAPKPHAAFPPP